MLSTAVRHRRRLVVLLVVAVSLLAPTAALAGRSDDDREQLVERQRELIAELDALAASQGELDHAIETLDIYIELKEAEVAHAQDVLAQATVAAEQARAAEEAKAAEVAFLEEQMREMAIAAYVAPPQADQMETMLNADAPGEAARLGVYLDVQNARDTDIVRQLRTAREQLGNQRQEADDAEERAATARDQAVTDLSDLSTARAQQADLHAQVVARTEQAETESGLVSLEIARLNQEAIQQAQSGRGSVPLTSVRGIWVHEAIASQLEALLAAAEADGIVLGGGGHRSNESQIALRRAHCGTDDYSVWEKPAGQCSPPTARPGTSMHEIGLAVDFTYQGAGIQSRSNPAFVWLDENAHTYGFRNLPSEPWHWSVNGN